MKQYAKYTKAKDKALGVFHRVRNELQQLTDQLNADLFTSQKVVDEEQEKQKFLLTEITSCRDTIAKIVGITGEALG